MDTPTTIKKHSFPPKIIAHTVWLYHHFCLSFRDVEELLAERWITVIYEAVRQWRLKFGQALAKKLRHRQGWPGDTWRLDEAVITIR
jgi:putative transposase